MKALGKSSNLVVLAMLVFAGLAAAYWMLALKPKREEAAALGERIESVRASLDQHRAEVAAGEEARKQFPTDYQKLVVLGKAVPGGGDTASLIVQLNGIAKRAEVEFRDFQLNPSGGEGEASGGLSSGGMTVSATEAAASLLPLGAAVGPAGLAVMPYSLSFDGNFFEIADFIAGLDSLVGTGGEEVSVDGRLITVDGFALSADSSKGFPALQASFAVTTYLTPPGQGVTGGASPTSPGGAEATPASTTIGATP